VQASNFQVAELGGGIIMIMKRVLWILIFGFFFAGISAFAVSPATDDTGFDRFFSDFQKAVGSGDKEKLADMINFEHFTWEENENLQQVKTKEAFLMNYNQMFTATVKKRIATGKPTKADDNSYLINWHQKGNEYSLDFKREPGGRFNFLGLTVGPY
jgi:hypothetical protein